MTRRITGVVPNQYAEYIDSLCDNYHIDVGSFLVFVIDFCNMDADMSLKEYIERQAEILRNEFYKHFEVNSN